MPFIVCLMIAFIISPELLAQTVPSTNALSFAPPVSDASVGYLSNIFGTVDGVLASTGSQMFGRMMGVYNMAILALGSIVIMYTLIIGTLNTAHEGEFLGKQWSSIWLPVRCCTGLALMVPKASGYNLIQIFIMWIVVQGVGAADKVWSAALDYLNAGGQLVVQQSSSKSLQQIGDSQAYDVYYGGMSILTGQVCMEGLQRSLEVTRELYLSQKDNEMGPCYQTSGVMQAFCDSDVPDFIGSVNAVDAQMKQSQAETPPSTYYVDMPNFKDSTNSFYASLNGVCGKLKWNAIQDLNTDEMESDYGMSQGQIAAMTNTRAIAVQQMYEWLSSVALEMVNNDPLIPNSTSSGAIEDNSNWASDSAKSQFGFAINNSSNQVCSALSESCTTWGSSSNDQNISILFSGNEFSNAIAAYDGVMAPYLKFKQDSSDKNQAMALRDFIDDSEARGWLMAGSYFYNMIALSGSPTTSSKLKDTDSGLKDSSYYKFPSSSSCDSATSGKDYNLCLVFSGKKPGQALSNVSLNYLESIQTLISGTGYCGDNIILQKSSSFESSTGYVDSPQYFSANRKCASTTFGFIGNSFFLYIPGADQYIPKISFSSPVADYDPDPPSVSSGSSCFNMKFFTISVCIKALSSLFNAILNSIVKQFFQWTLHYVKIGIQDIFIRPWVNIAWPMLQYALDNLNQQSINPIVNLGNMGITFVNYIVILYMAMVFAFLASLVYPPALTILAIVLFIALPLITSFFAVFLSIGFICAYYVPLLPYMIFTFGSISWFLAVIEAMVAGPIVALGVMSPEGEGILGKAEQGMMILVNVFLRPAMMIVGFVLGGILTYVFVWVLAEGYQRAAEFLRPTADGSSSQSKVISAAGFKYLPHSSADLGTIFGLLFATLAYLVIYVTMYMTVVEKAFELVHKLPDDILRWIGGHPESYGRESKEWSQATKEKVQKVEEAGTKAAAQSSEKLAGIQKDMGEGKEDQAKKAGQAAGGGVGGAGA